MMAEDLLLEGGRNGHGLPSASGREWHAVERAYEEILRRDGRAEDRAHRWERTALVLLGVVLVLTGLLCWLVLQARQVRTLVQVVRQEEAGPLVQVGVPQDLLAYTPAEGQWMELVGTWVHKRFWRSGEVEVQRLHWAWLYRHTCGTARTVLQHLETHEQPFKASDKRVTVQVQSVTKTPTPVSYQVLFTQWTTDRTQPHVVETRWTATFSVGRLQPPTLSDAVENRLGLCVAAFDVAQAP
jgi:type IV secretory pathway TrbF-like protein